MAADAARFAATGREARPLLADAAGVGAAAVPDTAQGASKYLMRKSLQWQLAEAQAGQHAAESQLSALHAKVAAAEEVQEQAEERARREAGRRHALDGELGQLKQQLRRADSRLERAAARWDLDPRQRPVTPLVEGRLPSIRHAAQDLYEHTPHV